MRTEKIKILLVDDDEITNFLSTEVLQYHFEKAEISVAISGEDALEILLTNLQNQQALPDIMLVDINMPSMTGWEFLEQLETSNAESFSNMNIFMYTSSVYYEDINRGKNHKLLNNILTKPLDENGIGEMKKAISAKSNLPQTN